jgi:tight adherence protein B
MMERMESPDLRIAVRALEVHGKVGGNLSEVLDSVASTMRERDELRGHIRALTAQQRLSIIVVSLLPVWAVGFFLVAQPDAISPLWEDPTGRLLLGLALVLETVSIFLMRKLVAIDI